ncbi:thiamine biosynthetic bifunctional enzyme TH1, chloroplastic [Abrus precatorius]|uniref:Thiamine biosynthetic bifunctional enzyme TH1, chloroplastic n=1 Tax=Abrus precatorius TaxID=3816 RepID=A0A8B8JYV0_ABRPR|nr:thiamine biosynthetic bifunctional enzyme TH1, chloroplastic [Abrus precatorius]
MANAELLCCQFDGFKVPPFVRRRLSFPFWNPLSNPIPKNQRTPFVKLQADMMHTSDPKIPHVLTVAGSDSGAGAGIQADLKTCAARRVYCSTVITAVTAQNTVGVQGVHVVPEDFVAEQLNSVLSDMHVDVVKTGMLPSLNTVKVLCQNLRKFPVKALVVDPVMISTSGDVLAGPSVLAGFREELLPMADIVTPNIKEASVLLGDVPLKSVSDMRTAAKLIHDLGPRNVLVKGGDLPNSLDAVDVFFDGKEFYELCSSRVNTCNTHGTGCTLASCIAAELAKGSSMLSSVKIAKHFIEAALNYSRDLVIGNGAQGPFDHFLALKNINQSSCRQSRFNPNDLLLYAVTDSGMNRKWGRSIAEAVKAAVEGGATIVQLREKDAETRDFLDAAKVCLKICRSLGVPLLINDRIDVALACDADGVHVGQSDMPARLARTLLGPEKIIGVSCKTPEQAQQAWIDGADYIGCGGVYATNTKANNRTVGLDGLKEVCKASKLPVVAIGGIGLSNAHAVMEIGVPNLKGVGVVSALFDRECILTETRNLHAIIS